MKIFIIILILIFIIINNNNINLVISASPYGFGLVDPNAICTKYIGDPIGQELCGNKLPNSQTIYTGQNITQQFINQIIIGKTFKSLTFLQSTCSDLNYAQFGLCDIYFPPCKTTTPIETPLKNITLPLRLCKSVCDRIVNNCPTLGASLNCSDANKFPELGTIYNLAPYGYAAGAYIVPCTDPTSSFEKNPGEMIQICPEPLVLKNQSDSRYSASKGYTYLTPTNCVLPCPAPYYSESKWHKMYLMSKIVSTVSLVCCMYNVLTFGILNHRKSKYNNCISFFSASVFLINLMDIVTYSIGYEKLLCPEPGRSAVQQDVSCGVTGAIFHFGITNGVLWWTTMAICLYAVVKRIKLFDFRYFIVFNTSVAIITLIIPLAGNAFMAGTGSLACWIRKTWYVNSVFWIPMGCLLFTGACCILLVIYEIYKISSSVSTKDNRILLLQLKPFLCVTLIGGSFLYLFIFNFDNERHLNKYRASITDYVKCLLAEVPGEECLSSGPDYAAYFVFYFFIRLFGILFFCIYGTSKNARDIWIHSSILNHPKIKPFLLKYNIINFVSATGIGSGNTNSKINSKKQQQQNQQNQQNSQQQNNNNSRAIEMDNSISKGNTFTKRDDDEETKGELESNINSASNTSSD